MYFFFPASGRNMRLGFIIMKKNPQLVINFFKDYDHESHHLYYDKTRGNVYDISESQLKSILTKYELERLKEKSIVDVVDDWFPENGIIHVEGKDVQLNLSKVPQVKKQIFK